jgi:hypothetical protein
MMKKFVFFSVLWACLYSLSLQAQSNFRIGLKINPLISFAGLTDKDQNAIANADASGRIGFGGGLTAIYQVSDKFGIQSGLQLGTRGFSVTKPNIEQASSVTVVEIPALLHMRTAEISNGIRARGIFGATMGFVTGASSDVKLNGITVSDKKGDNFNTFQFDFTFGAGAEWNIGKAGTFDVGLSYHLPLILLADRVINAPNSGGGNGYSTQEARLRLGYLALDLSYYF